MLRRNTIKRLFLYSPEMVATTILDFMEDQFVSFWRLKEISSLHQHLIMKTWKAPQRFDPGYLIPLESDRKIW